MKAVKIILITLIALAALIVLISFFLPDKVHVERKAVIHAPVAVVYGVTSDLNSWTSWDPWSRMEPTAKITIEGPKGAVGSVRKWQGEKLGSGTMTVTEVVPNEKLGLSLDFGGKGKAGSGMLYKAVPEGTEVTWTMNIDNGHNPAMRYMGLMMDKMIGAEYEKGLSNLDSVAKTIKVPAPAAAVDSTAGATANADTTAGTPPMH